MTDDERIDAAIAGLNEAYRRDPAAIATLFSIRATCNQALADDDNVICRAEEEETFSVGTLGVLNGVLLAMGLPRLAGVLDDEGCLTGFVRYRLQTGVAEG